ncbi:MAG: LuxR C-terminal-related transcriptional regulator [Pseudomonadota bacterium]
MTVRSEVQINAGLVDLAKPLRSYVAFYHGSRAFLDSLERFFVDSHFYRLRIASTKAKLDALLAFLLDKRANIVIDTRLPEAPVLIEQLRAFKGAGVRLVILAQGNGVLLENDEPSTLVVREDCSLCDLIGLMSLPMPDTLEARRVNSEKSMTEREWEVFSYGVRGFTRKEIAYQLNTSVHTVDKQLQEIKTKLKLRGPIASFARYARDNGWRF